MAVMQALLQIKAFVSGEGKVSALGRAIGGIQNQAKAATSGLQGMTKAASMGGLAGAMNVLAPLLSVAGLVGMAKKTLEAGDAMYDMSQRTGVAVESLAKFKKAASVSGTDLDAVAKALGKLSKGMYEASQTGKGPTAEALRTLGVSATDASGKLRSADAVVLDIATKFKNMPDGVTKTGLAMQLFGKAGAEMIPMLNMGGDAIDKLKVKMTTAFAEKADQYSDKLTNLSGKVGALGADIMIIALPALEAIADAMTALVDAFNKLDPNVRGVIVAVALLAISFGGIIMIVGALASAMTAIGTAWTGMAAILAGSTLVSYLAGIATVIQVAFSGLLTWLGSTFVPAILAFFSGPVGWTVLAVAAVVAMVIAFRKPIGDFLAWAWKGFTEGFGKIWNWLSEGFQNNMKKIGDFLYNIWTGIIKGIKSIFFSFIKMWVDRINFVIGGVNRLIGAFNQLRGPQISMVPPVPVPGFAQGGVVSRPTLAMVGEGGEREYIIPESKMAGASAAYISGRRGDSILTGSASAAPATINVQTGPVMQQDGNRWVTLADLERAMRQTESATLARLRTPSARLALGIR
jgi:hypothetical protein